jgi:hypothetical protein
VGGLGDFLISTVSPKAIGAHNEAPVGDQREEGGEKIKGEKEEEGGRGGRRKEGKGSRGQSRKFPHKYLERIKRMKEEEMKGEKQEGGGRKGSRRQPRKFPHVYIYPKGHYSPYNEVPGEDQKE